MPTCMLSLIKRNLKRPIFIYGIVALVFISTSSSAFEIYLGTDEVGSFSNFAGKTLCRLINRQTDEAFCRPVPMQDFAASFTNLQNGALDLALVNAKMMFDAQNGQGLFRFMDIQYDNLRLLLPLYKESITLVAHRGAKITSLRELEGKKVNGGAPNSMVNIVFAEIMKAKGWSEKNFGLFQNLPTAGAQDLLAFRSGNVQAMVHMGVHPDRKFEHTLLNTGGEIVAVFDGDIMRLINAKKGFTSDTIDSGVYESTKENQETLAVETLLISSADTDREAVSVVLETIFERLQMLRRAHPALLANPTSMENLKASYLQLHPAALQFFQDATNLRDGKPQY